MLQKNIKQLGAIWDFPWQVYFTKDEASIRDDQARAEAERARKAKQDRRWRVLRWGFHPWINGVSNLRVSMDQWISGVHEIWGHFFSLSLVTLCNIRWIRPAMNSQEEERKKREEIERKIREEAEKKRADEIASKKQVLLMEAALNSAVDGLFNGNLTIFNHLNYRL